MAEVDLLPHLSLGLQLAISMVPNSPLGGSDGCVPVQLFTRMWQQAIRHKERGGILQRVEEQYKTGGGGQETRVDR